MELHHFRAVVLLAACGAACACAGAQTKSAPPAGRALKADAAAQQIDYAQGLKSFDLEDYAGAKRSWAAAVRAGPTTPLGLKAAAHLRKVDQILDTLKEIDDDRLP